MNSRIAWKLAATAFLLVWTLWEALPPSSRPLVQVFEQQAANRDANLDAIISQATALNEANPEREYGNLWDATGTNSLVGYFPQFNVEGEAIPNKKILNRLQRMAAGKIKLGLDLQGGASFVLGMDTNKFVAEAGVDLADRKSQALSQAIEVLRRRVDRFGVAEPLIQPMGDSRIQVQMPGLTEQDRESVRVQLQKVAHLEFRLVHPESSQMLADDWVEPGYEVLEQSITLDNGTKAINRYLVKKEAERGMTGKYVQSAGVIRDQITNLPQIDFTLNNEGASLFGEITRENIGRQLAIVLDGELYSAPVIQGEIRGRGQISGDFTLKEAFELANVLENPLEYPVQIIEERTVDPTLGADSIHSGFKATVIGFSAVVLFMLGYYLVSGLIANFALLLNLVFLVGIMCSLDTTLTLPGIAGILLTVGMAVDANVLIFERIREELAAGKSIRGAVQSGYGKAFSTIFDANITTLIASIILINLGTGPVKGFGITLTIGILVSMFTALVVTRMVFDILLAKGMLKSIKMNSMIGQSKYDFLKFAKPAFIASWILILVGVVFAGMRGSDVMGVDFAGGDSMIVNYSEKVPVEDLRKAAEAIDLSDSQIQYQAQLDGSGESLLVLVPFDQGTKMMDHLKATFPNAGLSVKGLDKVGPSVGREIQESALVSLLLALLGILVYVAFRYEFSFAIGAVIAVIHDVLMTMGWFFLTGRQLSAPMVAAVLTIIGFSINDTIVIFDRIREEINMGAKGSFREIMNRAINHTLSRTLITSGTTLLAAGALYVFGGGVINDFAFTFVVGVITGTYSSIYIAGAIVLWWHKGRRPKVASQLVDESGEAAVPAVQS